MSVFVLDARLITLLKSYSRFGSGNAVIFDNNVRLFIEIVDVSLLILPTVPVATTSSSSLNNTSILSPIFKLDLSISLVNKIILAPDIFLTINLDDVL